MRLALGADHAGFELKEHLKLHLERRGHEVEDLGTRTSEPTDYPDYASQVARAVSSGRVELGLLVCGTGTGMAIAANKVPGVRAAPCADAESARLARAHNDANVLALAGRRLLPAEGEEILDTFLATPFDGGRHARRVEKIRALEAEACP
jgi:ribose 5-phosphate isomerase B